MIPSISVSSWSFPIFARLHRLTANQRGLAQSRATRAEGRVVPGGPIDDLRTVISCDVLVISYGFCGDS